MNDKPVVDLNWLCNWLEENSSGIYRPAREAAHVIRSMASELESLRAQLKAAQQSPAVAVPDDLKGELQAIVNLIDKPHCETLDSPTEFALSQSKSMRTGNVRSAIVKIIKSLDTQSPRITEQDAREIAISFYYYRTNQSKNTIESFKLWLNCEGRTLLDKLNEDK